MRRARLAADHCAFIQVPRADIAQVVHRHVVEADIDVAARPVGARVDDAGEHAERSGGGAGHQIDDGKAKARGRTVGLARHPHNAGAGLR